MARATAKQTADRIDHLQGMILEGEPNTSCLTFMRQTWGLSRAQGYRLLKKAWVQIHDDVEETGIERSEMLAWAVQSLMAAAGQAYHPSDSWGWNAPLNHSRAVGLKESLKDLKQRWA